MAVGLREPAEATGVVDETPPLLEVKNLEVVYHRTVTAIQGISLIVKPGSITGLVGTNGAGKTTTLQAIAGFMPGDEVEVTDGSIFLRGERIDRKPPHYVARKGVALIPERKKIFSTLRVEENLLASIARGVGARRFELEDVFALFPVLQERRKQVSGYLSGGERQMLAMAMGLLGTPELLLVDEMSLGLAPAIVKQLADVIRRLRADFGMTVLLVEQNALLVVELVDYAYVIENGRIVFEGVPERLLGHSDFREFYLGLGVDQEKTYRDVKEYRRKRRWFG